MALALPLDLHGTGAPATYWRITHTHLDHLQQQVTVWLHGWRDAAARAAELAPACGFSLILHHTDLNNDLHGVTTNALYEALKARAATAPAELQPVAAPIGHAILAGATDC